MFESYLKPPVSFPTLTGSIVTFNSQYALPLKSHTVDIDSVSGVSAINISATGKNIMADDVAFTNNYYLKSDGTITYSNAWKLSDYIIIPKVENLSIDYVNFPTSAGNVVYGFFDSEQVFISGVNAINHTIQVPSNACYMRLSIRKDAENIQLEIGTTTSAYEAYEGHSATIQIGSTVNEATYNARTGVLEVTQPSVQTIQLPPCPIDTQIVNNIWADTGDTTLQYPKFG